MEKNTEPTGEGGRLDARRHESSNRRRGPLVNVRNPEMERHRRHLEGETDQQKKDSGCKNRRALAALSD